jgi:membrane-bound lytic murein transglycosylase D
LFVSTKLIVDIASKEAAMYKIFKHLTVTMLGSILAAGCSTIDSSVDRQPFTDSLFKQPAEDVQNPVVEQPHKSQPIPPSNAPILREKFLPAAPPKTLLARIEQGFTLSPPESPLTNRLTEQYARKNNLEQMFIRAAPMLYMVVEEVEKRNLPIELAFIPFVESAFNPRATSHAGAHGPWQFMPHTGKRFGLANDRFRDDRRAWMNSTRAALDYLTQLHAQFKDWHLAIAAYNAGEGRVEGARKKAIATGLRPTFDNLQLPQETREYVPRVFALVNILRRSSEVTLPDIANEPSLTLVELTQDFDVTLAARFAGLSEAKFRYFNPSFSGPLIAVATRPELLLPIEAAQKFEVALANHHGATATWSLHKLAQPMSAPEVASWLSISVATLASANPIPNGHRYKAGTSLFVPRRNANQSITSAQIVQAVLMTEPMLRRVSVKPRKGETLLSLAYRNCVTPQQLQSWNKALADVNHKSKLSRKEVYSLWVPVSKKPTKFEKVAKYSVNDDRKTRDQKTKRT